MKINFNPPDNSQSGGMNPEEKTEYIELCRQLTSRNPNLDYPTLTLEILTYILKEVLEKAAKIDAEDKTDLSANIKTMFMNIDFDDTNYIGCVNIFSLQCILLFTQHVLSKSKNPAAEFKNVFSRTSQKDYRSLMSDNWFEYNVMKKNIKDGKALLDLYYIEDLYDVPRIIPKFTEYNTNVQENYYIYLINAKGYLTLDEIITSFLKRVAYCGLESDFSYADGYKIVPLEFLTHDIAHGKFNQHTCYGMQGLDFKSVENYYDYCKSSVLDKKILYSVKLILFLLLHESACSFFQDKMSEKELFNTIMKKFVENLDEPIKRFMNLNDLGESIPKEFRGSKDSIENYILESCKVYVDLYNKWKALPISLARKTRELNSATRAPELVVRTPNKVSNANVPEAAKDDDPEVKKELVKAGKAYEAAHKIMNDTDDYSNLNKLGILVKNNEEALNKYVDILKIALEKAPITAAKEMKKERGKDADYHIRTEWLRKPLKQKGGRRKTQNIKRIHSSLGTRRRK